MQNRYPIDADQILPEYPRPQMVRSSYFSLNGIWECAIANDPSLPDLYPYSIVVPFSPETKLSGLEKRVGVDQTISYRRTFTIPLDSGKRTILHFEAVDHFCIVYLNGMCIGSHRGGYLPFSFESYLDTKTIAQKIRNLRLRLRNILFWIHLFFAYSYRMLFSVKNIGRIINDFPNFNTIYP